ncbi:uncharacterized protein LAJ45_09422 [Morchella importuna]|uniref:uncharacterized protein n=1 Tax=Morchella importuna TaxID=1174673 RepID=UPI001E8CF20F|nr:uncharacterized protein LAJ45_09422 [Morchella importuna]KAH8146476.1 hypothetical protein LAJ45_09422 [Morchella importuna]
MAEAIGLASGIVGLATAAVQVTEISYRYYTGVKGAPTEIKELLDELNSLSQVLNALKDVAKKNPHSTALQKLSESINGVDGPLPQCLDMLNDLKTKLERSKSEQGRWRRFLHRLKWPLVQGDTQQYISRIQRQRSLFTTALNIDHLSLSTEIRESVGKTEIAIRDLQTQAEEEKKDRLAEKQTKKHQKTLHWLHPYDTVTKQIHITSRRHPNTGGWIFETPGFKAFEKASSLGSGSQLLWGYGIPGAGKSFLSSFIIDYFLVHMGCS